MVSTRAYKLKVPNLAGGAFHVFNPSLTKDKNGVIVGLARLSDRYPYADSEHLPQTPDLHESPNKNILFTLNEDRSVASAKVLDHDALAKQISLDWHSLEDLRIFEWQGDIWAIGSLFFRGLKGGNKRTYSRMALFKIIQEELFLETIFLSPLHETEEKNWTPMVVGEKLYLVYAVQPFTVFIYEKGRLLRLASALPPQHHSAIKLRGGSPLVHWKENLFIGIGHYPPFHGPDRTRYLHLLCVVDIEKMALVETSVPFYIQKPGIEFAAGLFFSGENLVISYGVSDRLPMCVDLDINDLDKILAS